MSTTVCGVETIYMYAGGMRLIKRESHPPRWRAAMHPRLGRKIVRQEMIAAMMRQIPGGSRASDPARAGLAGY